MMEATRIYRIQPTITPSLAYAAGFQLGPTSTKLANIVRENGIVRLKSIHVVDASKQKPDLDLLFWNGLPTVSSTDRTAFTMTAAETQAKLAGQATVLNADYFNIANAAIATELNLTMIMQAVKQSSNPLGQDLWVSLVTRGTPTFTGTTDIAITMAFEVS